MTLIAEDLRENQTIFVRGKVAFSRVASRFEGEALQRRIANSPSRYPTKVPHTTIDLVDAQVIPTGENGTFTEEEEFVAQKQLYVSKRGVKQGKTCYSINDVSGNLPAVLAPTTDEQGNTVHAQVEMTAELDNSLDVTLVLQTFKPKEYDKRGIGLQQIVVNEDIRFYSPASTEALSALGITVAGNVRQVPADQSQAAGQPDQHYADTDDSGLPTPGTGAPVQPTQPQQPAQPAQPVQPQQPQAQPAAAPAGQAQPQKTVEELEAEIAAVRAAQPAQQPAQTQPVEDNSPFPPSNAGQSPWG